MKRLALVLSPALVAAWALTHAACRVDTDDGAVRCAVVADLVAPRALLDRATTLSISVLEGEVTCDEKKGTVTLAQDRGKVRTVADRALAGTGCTAGARFCGDIPVEKSAAPRVFAATAKDSSGAPVAVGCTTAKVDQERLALRIRLLRYVEPPICGDGKIQPSEQCEPGGSELCDDACRTKEIFLSAPAASNGTEAGSPGDKTAPFALWPEGGGAAARFVVFFSDAASPDKRPHVALATRAPDFTRDPAPALSEGAIFLPTTATFPPSPPSGTQQSPAAAFAGGTYVVAYEDDAGDATASDIRVRLLSTSFAVDLATGALRVNGPSGAGELGSQAAPAAAAGPMGRVFVAWEDRGQGKIGGRVLTLPTTLGSQNDLSTGTGNVGVSVAAKSDGWVAVWQSGTGIKLRVVNEDGTPQGAEQVVSEVPTAAERPRVAALPDGRFVVAFTAGGDVYAQRYDAKGTKVPGDQAKPVNDLVVEGSQSQVAVATSNAASGSFVMAWVDEASGHVRARMLGGSTGFLFNPVDGQSSEFQASRDDAAGKVGKRRAPSVVAGGAGPHVAIVWEDQSDASPGIFGRRFPLGVE